MMLCGFLLGAAGQVVKLCADTAMQMDVDDALRGHVFTVQDALFWIRSSSRSTAAAAVMPADGHQPALALAGAGVYLLRAGRARKRRSSRPPPAKVTGMAGAGPMVADLRAESDELDALVADLPADAWAYSTPSPGWTIAHQIAHLLWTDRVALTAVTDEAGFAAVLRRRPRIPTGFVDAGAEELALPPPDRLLTDWRETRAELHDELLPSAEAANCRGSVRR